MQSPIQPNGYKAGNLDLQVPQVYSAFDLVGTVTSVTAQEVDTVMFQLGRVDPALVEKLYVGIVPEHVLAG